MSPRAGLVLVLLAATVAGSLVTPDAAAQPRPRRFASVVSYQSCSTSWAFACGKTDAGGRRYGTAHEQRHCQTYTFRPDGTVSVAGDLLLGLGQAGTYRLFGDRVRLELQNEEGPPDVFELPLGKGGATLGVMKRLGS